MTGPAPGRGGLRLADVPVVLMSYDEPWADETWAALRALRPDALRVHGVKGLNACHVAAAEAAGTDWFLTVDADSVVAPGFFDLSVPGLYLNPAFRIDWLGRNAVNGLVSGNGCVKLWPRDLVLAMRSHEAAPRGRVSLDADIGRIRAGVTRNIPMPGCHVETDPARTPFHAFRAGFREAAFLAHLRAEESARPAPAVRPFDDALGRTLCVWGSVGAHARHGAWVIYGARLALWMRLAWWCWDVTEINDHDRMRRFWQGQVLARIGPGGSRCPLTGVTWDAARLAAETEALGEAIEGIDDRLALATLGPAESAVVASAGLFPAARSVAAIDGLGRAFQKGRGVPADIGAARACFEIAAVLGHPSGFANLGRLHELGLGGAPDPAEAERHYLAATALGSRHAPYHLAQMLKARGPGDAAAAARIEALLDLAAERGYAGPDVAGSAA
ncbi:tetratricopeptide repeat protein [Rhodovulum euryhalinum]|uniref:Sel1 repeat-containing protein n=1 Tax=Rhodovulum euryhalinum TaxID=35805 RepID=A0A4R2KMQ3_9RHOB|nr:SEL1-like repeat protein [Rhodovulum euryhalinum]TCO72039.1 hypothetical protein EV655_105145 [Rhodovulum euryhalinum]